MTTLINQFSGRALAMLLTLVASATLVLGAVGPAYSAPASSQDVIAGLANVPGKSATSLA